MLYCCRCKLKFTSKFTDEEKNVIILELYDGQPSNEHDTYLQGIMERKLIARRRKGVTDEHSMKSEIAPFQYLDKKNEEQVPVCKRTFPNFYAILYFDYNT